MSAKTVERFIRWLDAYNPTRSYLLGLFKLDVQMVRGAGHYLYDANDGKYLDFLSQFGSVSLGHNHPELCETVAAFLQQGLPTMVQPLLPVAAQQLAKRLADITPGELAHSIFTNSGAEAVEAAIKLARVRTGRSTILSAVNGFHGKTLGALSATGKRKYQHLFGAPVAGFEYVPYGDLDALETRLRKKAEVPAAFLIEPIQGEGGVIIPPAGYIASALALCRQYGVLFILDEIQTGLGRTGELFALPSGAGVPDILLLAKTLGGGLFPIGACIATQRAWNHDFGYLHSSTFANNNLGCTIALKVIEILTRDDHKLIRDVARNGDYLLMRLRKLQTAYPTVIEDVRGRGLLTAIQFRPFTGDDSYTMSYFSNGDYLIAMLCGYLLNVHGIVAAPVFNHSHVLRLEPPFTIGRVEIDYVIQALGVMCDSIERKDYAAIIHYLLGSGRCEDRTRRFILPHPPNPPATGELSTKPSFAFLAHPTEDLDFITCDPSFALFSPEELQKWKEYIEDTEPGVIYHLPEIRSAAGNIAQGWLLGLGIVPDRMVKMSRRNVLTLLEDAVDLAKEKSARILGLGGFTSIVTKGGQSLTGKGIAITSGSSLTSIMAVAGVETVLHRLGRDLSDVRITVVGATGAIGRLIALLLGPRAGGLSLVGNPLAPDGDARLKAVAMEIEAAGRSSGSLTADGATGWQLRGDVSSPPFRNGHVHSNGVSPLPSHTHVEWRTPDIEITRSVAAATRTADVIVFATSSSQKLLSGSDLRPGAVLCDVSRPHNVGRELATERPDVIVFDGGLVTLPGMVHFGPNLQGFSPGINLACLAEAMLLALEGDFSDHSIGQTIPLAEVEYIAGLARKHGFSVAPPQWLNRELDDTDFKRGRAALSIRTATAVSAEMT